jgi:hypothetical protein
MTLSPPSRGARPAERLPGSRDRSTIGRSAHPRGAFVPLLCAFAGVTAWAACTSDGGIQNDDRGQGAGGQVGGGASGGVTAGAGGGGAGANAGSGPGTESGSAGRAGGTGGGTNGGGGSPSVDGLPCEVAAVMTSSCVSCHNDPPAGGAPMPLRVREHFQAPTPTDASKTSGQRAVERMQSASSPMPPSGLLAEADIATIEAWVSAGMPSGSCGGSGGSGGAGGSGGSGGGAGGSGGFPQTEGGLPCDVQNFLTAQCTSCHANPPSNGAPMPLRSYADLMTTNASGVRFAERALARLQGGTMPPGGGLSSAQFKAFADWVDAGAPEGSCAPVDDPFDDPPTCSSGQSLPFCNDDVIASSLLEDCAGPTMNPGLACGSNNCHASGGEGPRIRFAGTVYRSGHEPDRCVGGPAAGAGVAQVVVTGANGVKVTRQVNAAGNFVLLQSQQSSLTFPIRAEVQYDGRVRKMATPQMSGDCNSCHTQKGANGAPGRIVLP